MSTGCQKDRKTVLKTDRQTERQTDRVTDGQTDRFFSLIIKTKVVQNVNRMSKSQSDRHDRTICSAPGRQSDRETE